MEAKSSHQLDMLHGPIWNKIPQFAFPVAATAILGQLFNASDIAVVGNFSGSGSTIAVAAVGANSPIISLILNLFLGIALGANVVIAHAIGHGDKEAVRKTVHTSIVIAVIGGFLITIVGELCAEPLLQLLQVPEEVLPSAVLYLRIYFAGMPVILLYNFEAAIFRSIGETRAPLIALALSGVINVILNLFFVIFLNMTVNGVATATVIANAISAFLLFRKLLRSTELIHVEPKSLRIDKKSMRMIIRIGLPAGVQSAVFSIANIVIQSSTNSLGTVVMAGSSASYTIEAITYNLLNSFTQACTTFTSQNFGANNMQRCRKTLILCIVEGLITLLTAIAIVLILGRSLLAIFNNDPDVISFGYIRLMTVLISHVFNMLYESMAGYLRGFGISVLPALLSMIGVCGTRLMWVSFVFPQDRTFQTLMNVYPISLIITSSLVFITLLIKRPSRYYERLRSEKCTE